MSKKVRNTKTIMNKSKVCKYDMILLQLDNSIDKILRDCTTEEKIEYLQTIINKISDNG